MKKITVYRYVLSSYAYLRVSIEKRLYDGRAGTESITSYRPWRLEICTRIRLHCPKNIRKRQRCDGGTTLGGARSTDDMITKL